MHTFAASVAKLFHHHLLLAIPKFGLETWHMEVQNGESEYLTFRNATCYYHDGIEPGDGKA